MEQLKYRIKKFFNLLIETMKNPVMQILPGQIAFFFLLSIFPIILILGVLAPIFSISVNDIVEIVEISLPANTSKLLLPLIKGKSFDINIIVLIISALYLISRCTKSIIIASSTVHKVEKGNFIKNTIKSFTITILLALLFIFIAFITVFGGRILLILSKFFSINVSIIKFYNLIRWPITFLVIFIVVKVVYTLTPNKKIKSKTVNTGAMITTILWVLVTAIYSYYITHFSSYNIFYGSTANIVILMLWVYIISYIFVFGMVINVTKRKYENIDM